MKYLELPLLPATVLDPILGSTSGVQKLRQELRNKLGTKVPVSRFSFGRYGTANLEAAPMFPCLATGVRWDRARAEHLAHEYVDAGLDDLIGSGRFREAVEIAGKVLRGALKAAAGEVDLIRMTVSVISDLTRGNAEFRSFAEEMTRINRKVDDSVREVRRLPGRLIRVDGDEALVVLEDGDREQLRALPAALLSTTGITENGSTFVLHEMTWSPDLQSRIAIPAVDLERSDDERERRLTQTATPLPRPPWAA